MSPSPPPANAGEIVQHGLHHLVQHNSHTSYPQQRYDEGVHLDSNYGSPAPTDDTSAYSYRGEPARFSYQHQHQDSGLGLQYDYHPEYQQSMYQDHYSTPATSPPTPSMISNEVLRTRSGLTVQRAQQTLRPMPEGRSRIEKSPKPRKIKKEKVKAEKVAKLEKPLSELTRDYTHVAVLDIETYVNRSAEDRRKEVEDGKVPGKVKRPMNSFMLYRKAYQNRAKEWCLQNNHQVVSQVCGDSWPQEPDAIKDQFSEWARIERLNHQNAHPGYKFSPTKPGTAKAAKRKQDSEDISEESDLDDFEWQGGPTRRSKKLRQSPQIGHVDHRPVAYPSTKSAYQYSSRGSSIEPSHGGYNLSSYQATNPGRPLPAQYNQADLRAGEYYQQTIQNHPHLVGVSDVIMKRQHHTPVTSMHSYLGLPGGQDFDIMHQYPHPQFAVPAQGEHRIDPSLLGHDTAGFNSQYMDPTQQNVYIGANHNGDSHWQASYEHDPAMFLDPQLTVDGSRIQASHMDVLKGNQEGWQVETLDTGGEFDKWMDEE